MIVFSFGRARSLAAGLVLAWTTAACGAYEPTGPQGNVLDGSGGIDNSVQDGRAVIQFFELAASTGGITIPAGTVVEWQNVSSHAHSVSNYSTHPQAATWEDALVPAGGTFSHQFSQPGEYGFICIFHQEVGYITVVASGDMDDEMDMDMDDMMDMDMDMDMDTDMMPMP